MNEPIVDILKDFIGTQECVYRHSPVGKLEKRDCGIVISPLQQGFYSDSKTCFPITINYLPTFWAFEYGIVGTMPISQSTAMATPFACMPTIHNVEINPFIKTSLLKNLFKLIKWNTHNFLIRFFIKRFKSFQILDSNISVISKSHICDFFNNFPKPVFNKIPFLSLQSFKGLPCPMTAFISKRLKFTSSFHNLFSFYPNILPKIGLLKNLSFGSNNRYSKTFSININSKNVRSFWKSHIFFREIGNNLSIRCKTIGFALPAIIKQRHISFIVPVLLDRDSNSLSWIHSQFNKEICFSSEGFAISWNIKFNSNVIQFITFRPDNIPFNITNNLRIKGGVSLAF